MKKKYIFLLILPFLLTGCFNYRELNNLAIATALSIDKDGDEYKVSLLIANSKKSQASSKEGEAQTTVLTGTGKTLTTALQDLDLTSPKQTYLGHLGVIVVSNKVAEEGMNQVIDLLLRHPESRKKFYLLLSRDEEASDILKILTPLESFPAQNITTNIKNTKDVQSLATDMIYSKFVADLLQEGVSPTLSSIIIEGEVKKGESEKNLESTEPKAKLELSNLGIFRDDKLIGWATRDESRAINILNAETTTMILSIPCDDNFIALDIDHIKVSNHLTFDAGKPQINVKIKAQAAINEVNCQRDLEDPDIIKEIQKATEKQLQGVLRKGLDLTQKKYKTDVLGYGEFLYRKAPSYWQEVKNDWNTNGFVELKVTLDPHIELSTKGSLEQTIEVYIDEK